jgi:hypothetical protein
MSSVSDTTLSQMSGDDILAIWRAKPDAGATIALCHWIAGHEGVPPRTAVIGRETVVLIGCESLNRHGDRVGVLLAVGRMYIAANELSLAVDVLVRAAKVAAGEPVVFRLLGEALFRCGDADRAFRMFERAIAEGLTDPETLAWHRRAQMCANPQRAVRATPSPAGPAHSIAPSSSSVRTRSGVRLAAAASWRSSHTAVTRVGND